MSTKWAPSRCSQCGSRRDQCVSACREALRELNRSLSLDLLYDTLDELEAVGWSALLMFEGDLDTQRVLLNRLHAQWRGHVEVVDPTEPGDCYLARISVMRKDLRSDPDCEYWVSTEGLVLAQPLSEIFQMD